MSIKLLGLDLDGTLLTTDKRITLRTHAALTRAAGCGVTIVYLTGRPYHGVIPEIRHEKTAYIVSSNGAIITELASERIIRSRCMDCAAAAAIAEAAIKRHLKVTAFSGGVGYCEGTTYTALMDEYRRRNNLTYGLASRRRTEDLLSLIRADMTGIENLCIDTNDPVIHVEMLAVASAYPSLKAVTTRGHLGVNLELGHPEADKGLAFDFIAGYLSIQQSETMAIGDDGNDVGLLKTAGLSVAMENAVDAAKKASRAMTADNNHDGVALAIEKYILNGK